VRDIFQLVALALVLAVIPELFEDFVFFILRSTLT
jgi:hypothetical protein